MLSKAHIKYIKSLEHKKFRDKYGVFVAEGPKLVNDLRGHFELVELIEGDDVARVSLLETPQNVFAIFRQRTDTIDITAVPSTLSIALDNIQNPGNMGTIIRLADWFGIRDLFCSRGCADVYNPKVVQATMGSLARVNIHYCDLPQLISSVQTQAKQEGTTVPVYGTFLDGKSLYDTKLTTNGLIVMGNEGHGVSQAVSSLVTHRLLIPNYPTGSPTGESLNVAIATAVVCAEFRRQVITKEQQA